MIELRAIGSLVAFINESSGISIPRAKARIMSRPHCKTHQKTKQKKPDEGGGGEILEVNQVCAYFCYSNRTINGLGVTLSGDSVGYYAD